MNQNQGGGGAGGIFAVLALIVVLVLGIKIYSDYSLSQAGSPRQSVRSTAERNAPALVEPEGEQMPVRKRFNSPHSEDLDPLDGPIARRPSQRYDTLNGSLDDPLESPGRVQTRATARELQPSRPVHSFADSRDELIDPGLSTPSTVLARKKYIPTDRQSGAVNGVKGRDRSFPSELTAADGWDSEPRAYRERGALTSVSGRLDSPPTPTEIDRTDLPPSRPLFGAGSGPYPKGFDAVQVGDRLTYVTRLGLPGGRQTRSAFTYRPIDGPFSSINCRLERSGGDAVVRIITYRFRDAREYDRSARSAANAFGKAIRVPDGETDRLVWPDVDGYRVEMDAARMVVRASEDSPRLSSRERDTLR